MPTMLELISRIERAEAAIINQTGQNPILQTPQYDTFQNDFNVFRPLEDPTRAVLPFVNLSDIAERFYMDVRELNLNPQPFIQIDMDYTDVSVIDMPEILEIADDIYFNMIRYNRYRFLGYQPIDIEVASIIPNQSESYLDDVRLLAARYRLSVLPSFAEALINPIVLSTRIGQIGATSRVDAVGEQAVTNAFVNSRSLGFEITPNDFLGVTREAIYDLLGLTSYEKPIPEDVWGLYNYSGKTTTIVNDEILNEHTSPTYFGHINDVLRKNKYRLRLKTADNANNDVIGYLDSKPDGNGVRKEDGRLDRAFEINRDLFSGSAKINELATLKYIYKQDKNILSGGFDETTTFSDDERWNWLDDPEDQAYIGWENPDLKKPLPPPYAYNPVNGNLTATADDFYPPKSILAKTAKLIRQNLINPQEHDCFIDLSAKEFKLLNENGVRIISRADSTTASGDYVDDDGTQIVQGEYFRVWTKRRGYNRLSRALRHRALDNGDTRSVLQPNGLLNFAPTYRRVGYNPIFSLTTDDIIKRYMFSIENLAWHDFMGDLPECEQGVGDALTGHRGRLMWFPPYDLEFTENTKADWQTHNFIGRGEPIFTYNNSQRSGTLKFALIMDYPAIVKNRPTVTEFWERYFKGDKLVEAEAKKILQVRLTPQEIAEIDKLRTKPTPPPKPIPKPIPVNPIREKPEPNEDSRENIYGKPILSVHFPNQMTLIPPHIKSINSNPLGEISDTIVIPIIRQSTTIGANGGGRVTKTVNSNAFGELKSSQLKDDHFKRNIQYESARDITLSIPISGANDAKNQELINKEYRYKRDESLAIVGRTSGRVLKRRLVTNNSFYSFASNDGKLLLYSNEKSDSDEKDRKIFMANWVRSANNNKGLLQTWYNTVSRREIGETGFNKTYGKSKGNEKTCTFRSNETERPKKDCLTKSGIGNYVDRTNYGLNDEFFYDYAEIIDKKIIQVLKDPRYNSQLGGKCKMKITVIGNASGAQPTSTTNLDLSYGRANFTMEWLNEYLFSRRFIERSLDGGITPNDDGLSLEDMRSRIFLYEDSKDLSESNRRMVESGYDDENEYEVSKGNKKFLHAIGLTDKEDRDKKNAYLAGRNINGADVGKFEGEFCWECDDSDFYFCKKTRRADICVTDICDNKFVEYPTPTPPEPIEDPNPKSDPNPNPPNPPNPPPPPIDPEIIQKLIYEPCDYFEFLEINDPIAFKTINEKIKYFHPAFHSVTPQGYNKRLVFLQQCLRQADNIGLEGVDNVKNLAFGRPPVCILRIGDFYHTKVIFTSLDISYSNGMRWDMNPEGVGVQPMYADVSMNVEILGGSSMTAPINRLQNALSFNFYANTEMYDYRADSVIFKNGIGFDKDGNLTKGEILDGIKLSELNAYIKGKNERQSDDIRKDYKLVIEPPDGSNSGNPPILEDKLLSPTGKQIPTAINNVADMLHLKFLLNNPLTEEEKRQLDEYLKNTPSNELDIPLYKK